MKHPSALTDEEKRVHYPHNLDGSPMLLDNAVYRDMDAMADAQLQKTLEWMVRLKDLIRRTPPAQWHDDNCDLGYGPTVGKHVNECSCGLRVELEAALAAKATGETKP